ncbi:MAG: DUF3575 domain-containing protein [Bacteroidales bacterium]|nr:DUF3575 domain-containing protein [Bacteroidales bacterium]
MKKLMLLTVLVTGSFLAASAQENPVVPPDTLKIPADTLQVMPDTLAVVTDTLVVAADTLTPPADTLKAAPAAVVVAEQPEEVTETDTKKASAGSEKIPKNMFKVNLSALFLKTYSLQYERVLSRTVSMAISGAYMPETYLPYTDQIIKWSGATEPEEIELIENVRITNLAITPEIRFYTGKKRYGSGFYTSIFYRYGQHSFTNALVDYENDLGETGTLDCWGDATSHTAGIMIGAQWSLGKHVCLDWWILGPHFGISSGNFEALSSLPLSEADQQEVEDRLNDIDIPMFEQTVSVTSEGATMIFDGPWGGIRAGLSIGIKF